MTRMWTSGIARQIKELITMSDIMLDDDMSDR